MSDGGPNLIYDRPDEVCEWVRSRIPWVDGFGGAAGIGIEMDGVLAAGAVYANFRGSNIEASIAADRPGWCNRTILRALFSYPFIQLGCSRITCLIPAGNEPSLKLCRGLGFLVEGFHPALFPGEVAGWSYGMLRGRCRWIGSRMDG